VIDALIVGGGPVGLATAILARESGLRVVVAEPRPGPVDKACGEGLMPPAVARLTRLGVRLDDGHPLAGIRYRTETKSADAPFSHGEGRGVRRTALHRALAERAEAVGVEVVPRRVLEFAQKEDCVEALGMRARYLIAADGLHSGVRRTCGLDPAPPRNPRFGLRRHYRVPPWTAFVEVHWAAVSEAYVTPLGPELVGVAILGPARTGGFDARLAAFPQLARRLAGARGEGDGARDRGAGPLRQDVRARVHGRVLLVGDASGYVDALTGEGVSVGLAQAEVLVESLLRDDPGGYERRWRRVSRRPRLLTEALVRARSHPVAARGLVPAAAALPRVFTKAVNLVAGSTGAGPFPRD
jgi:flavin-dependent dehydrogenase